jgi:hypothetical protein
MVDVERSMLRNIRFRERKMVWNGMECDVIRGRSGEDRAMNP